MAKINVEQAKARLKSALKENVSSAKGMRKAKSFVNTDNIREEENDIELVDVVDENLFIFKKNESYVLSPADDNLNPIIGEFDEIPEDCSMPPCFKDWLDSYAEEVDCSLNNEGADNPIELIDLGLPSGTKWGNMNLGAESPEDCGDYYAWGELEPKDNFTWANYKLDDSVGSTYKSKDVGSDISKNILYDAAYNFNRSLCLPTVEQWTELIKNCTLTDKVVNGKNVCEIKGPNGNVLILPYCGYIVNKSVTKPNTYGCYMSSTIHSTNTNAASKTADFVETKKVVTTSRKMIGRSVRPVASNEIIDDKTENGKVKLVDLGLSVDWADTNLGAESPEDYGDYYAWGELEIKEKYSWDTYKWYDKENSTSSTPITLDIGSCISKTIYDKAFKTNTNICLPTEAQWNELLSKCTLTETTINSVKGFKVVGTNGNSIFLPLTGYILDKKTSVGSLAYYMTGSTYSTNTNQYAKTCNFTSGKTTSVKNTRKRAGIPIRPVSSKVKNTKKKIEPILPFTWGQGAPFNNLLPLDPATGKTVITGCVQTALAQVMAYYGCMGIKGKKYRRGIPPTPSYTTSSGTKSQQVLPALGGVEQFDYDNLNFKKNSDFKTAESKKAVGELMQHLGYMNKANYTSSNTTASTRNSVSNVKNYIHLASNPKMIYASDGIEIFNESVYSELEQGYPVIMGGYNSKGNGGHTFVCDGYDPSTDKYHFNWGWNGSYNGWFDMSLLNAGTYDLSYFKFAVMKMHPDYDLGDVNGDNSIDVTDVMNIVQDIINKKVYDYKKDINFDGQVNEDDISLLIEYILGKKK